MSSNIELIKTIRYKTNLSFKDIKNAIEALNTDNEAEIIDYLKKQGVLKSAAKEGREAAQGSIFTYTHEMRIGVMIEIKCETDFVARGEDFQQLGKELCLHIAAYQPKFVSDKDVSQEYIESELALARTKLEEEGKAAEMITKILEGKKAKMAKEVSLLSQPFLMNMEISVDEHVRQLMAKSGENLQVSKFVVYNLNG
jgi:elongation factor Ts